MMMILPRNGRKVDLDACILSKEAGSVQNLKMMSEIAGFQSSIMEVVCYNVELFPRC